MVNGWFNIKKVKICKWEWSSHNKNRKKYEIEGGKTDQEKLSKKGIEEVVNGWFWESSMSCEHMEWKIRLVAVLEIEKTASR